MNSAKHTTDTLTPEQFIAHAQLVLPQASPAEARRLVEHATAWAQKNYPDGLPPDTLRLLNELRNQESTLAPYPRPVVTH